MYKLYTIAKKKTGILGLWQDEKGRIYRDKIKIKTFPDYGKNWSEKWQLAKDNLFIQGEKAIFYVYENKAYILTSEGKRQVLHHRITWQENKLRPSLVKALLVQHGGFTVYKNEKGFLIELYKA
jgi:hypothetical protein